MITNVPLMIVPLIVYNLVLFGVLGANTQSPWDDPIFVMDMISGATWVMTLGDLMIALGLILLFFEILKATRVGTNSIVDHLLSTFIFVAFLVEFLLVQGAATAVFFILMMMTMIDVLAGFSVSIRSATRDVALGGGL
jgi:hypothetical protein